MYTEQVSNTDNSVIFDVHQFVNQTKVFPVTKVTIDYLAAIVVDYDLARDIFSEGIEPNWNYLGFAQFQEIF